MKTSPLAYSRVVGLAWPFILANSAVPLLGLVDTAVIGNLGSAQDLGAIAFGALIFSFVYWGFGFLRMGTTGFVAQAAGAADYLEVRAVLGRSLLLAAGLGCLLVVLQLPVQWLTVTALSGSADVEQMAALYFSIRIWGAPATLIGFVGTGFLVGMGRSKTLLVLQLFLNGLNIVLDILLAGVMGLGAAGIALGTVISEWCAVLFGAVLLRKVLLEMNPATKSCWPREEILNQKKLAQSLSANLDIMIRTLLLVFSFAFFTNQGADLEMSLWRLIIFCCRSSHSAHSSWMGLPLLQRGSWVALSALAIRCSLWPQSGARVCWLQCRQFFWLQSFYYSVRI